jgi:AcrR family transcriptional regulator
MTRLGLKRDTHLTPSEIGREALRQFDEQTTEPSTRSLASALRVAPSAIYHHFPSRAAVFQAAVELVWAEATSELLQLVPRPMEADAEEVLVAAGIATRRAWLHHHRLVPYMAATPEANQVISDALGLMAVVFERLGLRGERAASAFHTYASFMLGAVLFAAERKLANEKLELEKNGGDGNGRFRSEPIPAAAERSSEETRISIDDVMDVSIVDPARDEELFAEGLRRLVLSVR